MIKENIQKSLFNSFYFVFLNLKRKNTYENLQMSYNKI